MTMKNPLKWLKDLAKDQMFMQFQGLILEYIIMYIQQGYNVLRQLCKSDKVSLIISPQKDGQINLKLVDEAGTPYLVMNAMLMLNIAKLYLPQALDKLFELFGKYASMLPVSTDQIKESISHMQPETLHDELTGFLKKHESAESHQLKIVISAQERSIRRSILKDKLETMFYYQLIKVTTTDIEVIEELELKSFFETKLVEFVKDQNN
ncbi:hypothetical protein BKI52_02735 [marine bacterium AO1-C]|nr:hypothetical protein BKI52_02735 [marine bacterium AO1-C]